MACQPPSFTTYSTCRNPLLPKLGFISVTPRCLLSPSVVDFSHDVTIQDADAWRTPNGVGRAAGPHHWRSCMNVKHIQHLAIPYVLSKLGFISVSPRCLLSASVRGCFTWRYNTRCRCWTNSQWCGVVSPYSTACVLYSQNKRMKNWPVIWRQLPRSLQLLISISKYLLSYL